MNWFRVKNNLAAFYAALIAAILLLASFYGTDAEVYLFPRIAAVCIAILALVLLFSVFTSSSSNEPSAAAPAKLVNWSSLLPGLAVGVAYILSLEKLGFYASSFLAFLVITMLYGKRGAIDPKAVLYKLLVSAVFMSVLYLLFWKLLHVRTPTGLLL